MQIDWIHTPVYNNLMSLAAGVALLLLVTLARIAPYDNILFGEPSLT